MFDSFFSSMITSTVLFVKSFILMGSVDVVLLVKVSSAVGA